MSTNNVSLDHVLAALRTQLAAIHAHEAGARAGRDPEQLHRMRVAVRRFRAILRASRSLFETAWVKALRRELDWLGTALGNARDLDVLRGYLAADLAALDGPERKAGRALLRHLDADRARARETLNRALEGRRYSRLLARLETALAAPRVAAPDVSLPGVAAAEFKKLRRAVRRLPRDPSADQFHEIRIKVKRAHYAAELARAAAGRPVDKFIKRAKKIQDILGEHQDAVVIEEYLHHAIDSREAVHALGQQLLKRQRRRRKKARAAFFEQWPKLARRGRKAWTNGAGP